MPKTIRRKAKVTTESRGEVSWTANLEYVNKNGTTSGMSAGGDTLEEAIEQAIYYALYYLGIGKSSIKIATLDCQCKTCYGTGKVTKMVKRFNTHVKCSKCDGVGTIHTIGPIAVQIPDSVFVGEK